MYFPTLSKRELWSEYMKDLKSRQVNDSTMKLVLTFNLCGTHAYWSFAPSWYPVPPLVRYDSLSHGSYAVG